MGHQQVWVDRVELVDEHLQHWSLALEHMYVRLLLCSDLRLHVMRKRLLVKLPDQGEALEILVLGRPVLVDTVVNDARNHGDLISVVLGAAHFSRKGQRDQGWAWFVDILN